MPPPVSAIVCSPQPKPRTTGGLFVRRQGTARRLTTALQVAAAAAWLAGCSAATAAGRAPATAVGPGREVVLAQAAETEPPLDEEEVYDPWEPFNERIFAFNYNVDRYVLKPVARGYRAVVPERVQVMIANGFDNIAVVPRVVNSLLQGKVEGALREVSRFLVNSTLGVGGLFDAGKHAGLEPSREDFGQTLGVWGVGPGPYLVLPLMPPMTVRDGIGRGVDGVMDPLSYVLPFIWERLAMKVGETVNERALNYELFQGVEETTLDLYSSVRHFYLKRREQQIKE
jgi:phospholipid-binding lipoprotein MlaA